MAGPLQIEHLELALDPEAPFHLNFGPGGADRGEVVALLGNAVASPDLQLAVRAVSLCGHLELRGTLAVLTRAAKSRRPVVREAVAAALEFRRDDRPELLASLLIDAEVRVKVQALAVLAHRPARRRVRHLAALKRLRTDPDPGVRGLARRVRVLRGRASAAADPVLRQEQVRPLQRTM